MPLPKPQQIPMASLVALVCLCSGCGVFYSGPDFDEIQSSISTNGDSLAELEAMLAEDFSTCVQYGMLTPGEKHGTPPLTIGIGHDHVCGFSREETGWNEYGGYGTGVFAADPDTLLLGLDLPQVLTYSGISKDRYDRYLRLIERFNANQVTFGVEEDGSHLMEFPIAYWGTVTSSWDLWLGRYEAPPFEETEDVMATIDTGCTLVEGDWYVCQVHT